MKNWKKGLLITALVLALGGTVLTAAFAASLRESLSAHKRKQLRDSLRLQARVSQLEDVLETDDEQPVVGEPATQPIVTETETERVGEVTHPEALSPATTPAEPETTCLYRVAAYEGIIGVFDESGRLLRTVNVRLDTLPSVDQDALTVGIIANSWQELQTLVEQYS